MRLRAAAAGLVLLAGGALAAEATPWPPSKSVEARMRELQQVIFARESTMAQRVAARDELAGLLKSPAGRARGPTLDEQHAPRAAIDPYPSVVVPVNIAPPPPPAAGVAHVEVVVPSKPAVILPSGADAVPAGPFTIDPRTGNVLHETLGGYVDPRTGQFIPR